MSDFLYNIEFQRSVMRLVIEKPDILLLHSDLFDERYFESSELRKIYKIIHTHIDLFAKKTMDLNELFVLCQESLHPSEFEQVDFVDELIAIFESDISKPRFIIDRLTHFAQKQSIRQFLTNVLDTLDHNFDPDYIEKEFTTALSVGSDAKRHTTGGDITSLPSTYQRKYAVERVVRTGFLSYDTALGGLAPKELHTIVAPPKCGKSTIASSIGAQICASDKVVYHATLEIDEIDVLSKYALRMTGMTYRDLMFHTDGSIEEKYPRVKMCWDRLFIKWWEEKTATTADIRSWISRSVQLGNPKPDIIIIDYDDCLVPSSQKKDDLYSESGQIYTDLLGLAAYFDCPILTFSQPTREAWTYYKKTDKFINAGHIAHSGRKVHKCHSIATLNFKETCDTEGYLYIDLARRGRSGVEIPIKRDLSRATFLEDSDRKKDYD